jgi:hypothetical protein
MDAGTATARAECSTRDQARIEGETWFYKLNNLFAPP